GIGPGHPVLHVYGGDVRIYPLIKIYRYTGRTTITGGGGNIRHALYPVDLFLDRDNNAFKNSLRIGSWIVGGNLDGWRGNVRILGNGQGSKPQNAQDGNYYRYNRR